jgi:malonyl-CoA O-methyltransferase
MDRLEPIRMMPGRLLELGSAAGHLRAELVQKYRDAEIISIEADPHFCAHLRLPAWQRLWRTESIVSAEPTAVPLRSASIDMVCANLAWVSAQNLRAVIDECVRLLRPQGLLMVVGYGPQTLQELRETWAGLDLWQHTNEFVDMHDLGDSMLRAGLADVVVDSERLHVEFDDVSQVLGEIRDIGGGNQAPGRRPGLMSPHVLSALHERYPSAGSHVNASVELVFAHAWLMDRPGIPISISSSHDPGLS